MYEYRKTIIDQIAETNCKFGFIAGDNIYPRYKIKNKKTKSKEKHVFIKTLNWIDYAKSKLINSNKHTYMIFGNHDIEDQILINYQIKLKDSKFEVISNTDIVKAFMINHINYICIDSNIFFSNIKDETYIQKIILTFKHNCQNIIITHEPIHSMKTKKNVEKTQWTNIGLLVLECIKQFLLKCTFETNREYKDCKHKFLFMSADTHLFQLYTIDYKSLEIEFTIPCITVGTGGAELDTPFLESNPSGLFQRLITGHQHINGTIFKEQSTHGYVLFNPEEMSGTFIEVSPNEKQSKCKNIKFKVLQQSFKINEYEMSCPIIEYTKKEDCNPHDNNKIILSSFSDD